MLPKFFLIFLLLFIGIPLSASSALNKRQQALLDQLEVLQKKSYELLLKPGSFEYRNFRIERLVAALRDLKRRILLEFHQLQGSDVMDLALYRLSIIGNKAQRERIAIVNEHVFVNSLLALPPVPQRHRALVDLHFDAVNRALNDDPAMVAYSYVRAMIASTVSISGDDAFRRYVLAVCVEQSHIPPLHQLPRQPRTLQEQIMVAFQLHNSKYSI
jgi:hypothetical protein